MKNQEKDLRKKRKDKMPDPYKEPEKWDAWFVDGAMSAIMSIQPILMRAWEKKSEKRVKEQMRAEGYDV